MKFNKLFAIGRTGDYLALLAGAALTLAFAPFHLFPIAILSPALLLGTWLSVTPQRAFRRGFLYGLGFFGTGVYWVYISIHTYGDAPVWLAGIITIGFICILALFSAMTGFILNYYFPTKNKSKILCAFPAIWVLLEWIRGFIFTGFPWLLLGYSQVYSPLKGYAPLLGVLGISLITLFSSSLIVFTLLNRTRKKRHIAYYCLSGLVFIWLVGACLNLITWTKPLGEPIQVSLVQGNIAQTLKWSPDAILPTLKHYEALTKQHWDSRIIIWPEAAIPIMLQDAASFVEMMAIQARQHQTTIISGIPIKADGKPGYYNALIALGNDEGFYLKQHLVPFGEYVPIAVLPKLLNALNIPMSNFIPGPPNFTPLSVAGIPIASFICYEIAYAEYPLLGNPHIGLLLVVSNDAWFGHSIALAQHLEIAQMRALESQRPVLFIGNSGITAMISPHGNIQSKAPPYQVDVLTDKVQARSGFTPWQRYKTDPLFLILIAMLMVAIRQRKT